MPCNDTLRIEICQELDQLSEYECHPDWGKGGTAQSKCTCVQVLRDPCIRMVTANWLTYSFKCPKEVEDNKMIMWYQFASISRMPNPNNPYSYVIPFSNVADHPDEQLVELTAEHYEELNTKFFCTSAIMAFMQHGRPY